VNRLRPGCTHGRSDTPNGAVPCGLVMRPSAAFRVVPDRSCWSEESEPTIESLPIVQVVYAGSGERRGTCHSSFDGSVWRGNRPGLGKETATKRSNSANPTSSHSTTVNSGRCLKSTSQSLWPPRVRFARLTTLRVFQSAVNSAFRMQTVLIIIFRILWIFHSKNRCGSTLVRPTKR
jgi:hypothetical protein